MTSGETADASRILDDFTAQCVEEAVATVNRLRKSSGALPSVLPLAVVAPKLTCSRVRPGSDVAETNVTSKPVKALLRVMVPGSSTKTGVLKRS